MARSRNTYEYLVLFYQLLTLDFDNVFVTIVRFKLLR